MNKYSLGVTGGVKVWWHKGVQDGKDVVLGGVRGCRVAGSGCRVAGRGCRVVGRSAGWWYEATCFHEAWFINLSISSSRSVSESHFL